MKYIVVDIPSGLAYPSSVLSALKVYVKRNAQYNLYCCGDKANFSVLEDTEGISCVYGDENEPSVEVALKVIRDNKDIAGLMSFSERSLLLEKAKEILSKNVNPTYGLLYETKVNDRSTMMIDASGLVEGNEDNFEAALSYAKDYFANILMKANIEIALLALEGSDDPLLNKLDEKLRQSEKHYHGFILPLDIFNGTMDIILSLGHDGAIAIQAAKGSTTVSEELKRAQASKSFSSLFGGSKDKEKPRFDSRIDQQGYLLFGFGENILCLNKDSGYGDVIDAFPTLVHLDTKKHFK